MLNWDDPLGTPKAKTTPKPTTIPATPSQSEEQLVAETVAATTITDNNTVAEDSSKAPVQANDKRVVNGLTDVNQLAPFKYPWAWDFFLNANKNHWTPLDVNMTQDVHDFQHSLTDDERHVYTNVLAYLTTSDILAMRNIGLAVMEKMTAPELQIYQARQVYEECLTTGHEVLTKQGWLAIEKVQEGEEILTYNQEGKYSQFDTVTKTHKYTYSGNLNHFKSTYFEQVTTNNHRMPYLDRNKKTQIKFAEEFPEGLQGVGFINQAPLKNQGNSLSIHQKFLIALQADGTIFRDDGEGQYKHRNGNHTGHISCSFVFSKERKQKRLETLLESLAYVYTKNKTKTEPHIKQRFVYRVSVPVTEIITKNFSDWVHFDESVTWCKSFISELTQWDGFDYRDKGKHQNVGYDTTVKANAEIAHAIGVLAGYRVHHGVAVDDRKQTYKDLYRLTFVNKDTSRNTVKKTVKQVTDKPVYCITVPSSLFIVRYNKKVSITHNSLHIWTYQHCIETMGLDQGEIYNRYRVVPAINQKIQVANRRLNSILRPDIDLNDPDELNNFVMAYMFFAAIFEGCWFYNGFSPIFALQRRGLMKGTAEQLQYIMRDEVMHASFGLRVVKQIILENNVTLDPKLIREMWDEAEAAESGYAHYILQKPILGYSAEDHIEQFRFIANRRARQLSLEEPFPGAEDTLPWLDEQANMRKEKNFFETRVTEYQTGGGLDWE